MFWINDELSKINSRVEDKVLHKQISQEKEINSLDRDELIKLPEIKSQKIKKSGKRPSVI